MSRTRSLLREVHRRNVWRNAGIFVGGGWGVLQVFDLFIERGFIPEWVFGGALLTLALGLPLVVLTSWVQGGGSEWAEDADGPDLLDLFTWRRTVAAGVLAFAFLGVLAAGYMLMRVTGVGMPGTLTAQGVFEEGGRIVLADFESTAGDAAPSELITETLRIDLGQSTAFSLLSPATVRETLGLMRRQASDGVSEDVAREVAVRNGVGAVVSGEVGRLGSGYVLNARVVVAESGEILAPFRVTADSDDDLIDAIDDLSRAMRSKIGESLRSVAESESLPDVTTSSLEALRRYTTASNRLDRGVIDSETAQQLFREAIQLDSTFAAAYRALAITISNYGGDRETQAWAATEAYRHRERLAERERLATEGYYYKAILGDDVRAVQAYRSVMERSESGGAAVNIADSEMYAGNYDEAVRILRIRPMWDSPPWIFNMTASLSGAGEYDAAVAVRDTVERVLPDEPYSTAIRALLAATWERPEEARAVLEAGPEPRGPARATQWITESLVDVLEGRLDDAVTDVEQSVETWRTLGQPGLELSMGLIAPLILAIPGENPVSASEYLDRLLADLEWESMSPVDRAYPFVALTRATAGDLEGARDALRRYEEGVSEYPLPVDEAVADIAAAFVRLAEEGETALPAVESAVARYRCARCRDLLAGLAHDRVGNGADAIARYGRYLEHRFFDGSDPLTFYFTAYVRERLGLLHDEAGNAEQAVEHLSVFVDLWANADEVLQPRVRHARERLAALRSGA